MSKRRGLGRGLGALIPTDPVDSSSTGVRYLPVSQIRPNPRQPRSAMDQGELAELAASIDQHGLIQPLVVTEASGHYLLIAGERRWRAARLAGLSEVPAIVKEATPQAMLEMALIENIQRADLNPIEEAFAYQQLADDFGLTHDEVAQRVGKSRATITNLVRLLKLPADIQKAVVDGRLSGGHARALLPLPTAVMQTNLMNDIVKYALSVRQTEERVRKLLSTEKPKPRPRPVLSPEMADLQRRFQESLGTRVRIEKGSKGGKVVIHYYSDEDLQAIYDVIVGDSDRGGAPDEGRAAGL